MNKVYCVVYKKYNEHKRITVLARTAGDAFTKAERWLKKNYTSGEIITIEYEMTIDVIYKS